MIKVFNESRDCWGEVGLNSCHNVLSNTEVVHTNELTNTFLGWALNWLDLLKRERGEDGFDEGGVLSVSVAEAEGEEEEEE